MSSRRTSIPPCAAPVALVGAILAALLCAGCERHWVCDAGDGSGLPRRLSDTGLYADISSGELAPGVRPFTPRFELWSDGAEKQRWILLPHEQQVDTSNQDDWIFPLGTKVWKQFSLEGVRIETRLVEKYGPNDADWGALAYVWDADERDATAAPLGVLDSHGGAHDVPAAGECLACHGGRASFVLGFSAVQLAGNGRVGDLTLDELIQQGQLTHPPTDVPVVPGDAIEVAALGYLHANCGHCHNPARPSHGGSRCFAPEDDYDFTLAVDQLEDTRSTSVYRTVVGHAVKPGNPEDSKLFERMKSRGFLRQMPPLATEQVDRAALANLRDWIERL